MQNLHLCQLAGRELALAQTPDSHSSAGLCLRHDVAERQSLLTQTGTNHSSSCLGPVGTEPGRDGDYAQLVAIATMSCCIIF